MCIFFGESKTCLGSETDHKLLNKTLWLFNSFFEIQFPPFHHSSLMVFDLNVIHVESSSHKPLCNSLVIVFYSSITCYDSLCTQLLVLSECNNNFLVPSFL